MGGFFFLPDFVALVLAMVWIVTWRLGVLGAHTCSAWAFGLGFFFFFVSRRVVFCDLLRVDGTGILSPGCLLGGFQGGSRVWDGFLPFFLFSPLSSPLFSILKKGGGEVFAAARGIFFFFGGGIWWPPCRII